MVEAVGIIENPLFDNDKQSRNSSTADCETAQESRQLLIGNDNNNNNQLLANDPRKRFGLLFSRGWTFGICKVFTWLSLFVVFILLAIRDNLFYREDWFRDNYDCWKLVSSYFLAYGKNSRRMLEFSMVLLATCTLSLLFYWKERRLAKATKPSKMPSVGLLDICFSIFSVLNLLILFVNMALITGAEFTFYYPKLANASMGLAEQTGWQRPVNHRDSFEYDWEYRRARLRSTTTTTTTELPGPTTTTFAPHELQQMEHRRSVIVGRLIQDPIITLLLLLAILLHVVHVLRTVGAIKRTKLWVSDYATAHPGCSPLDTAYARFCPIGLLKAAQWMWASFIFILFVYGAFPYSEFFLYFAAFALACFAHWLFYIHKVRFAPPSAKTSIIHPVVDEGLGLTCKMDCLLSALGIAFYLFIHTNYDSHWRGNFAFPVFVGCFLFAGTILFNLWLLFRYRTRGKGGNDQQAEEGSVRASGFSLNIPAISINFSVNVTRNQQQRQVDSVKKSKDEEVEPDGSGSNNNETGGVGNNAE